jgi:cbb3-type cytochrome oxidase subunit 1
LAVPTWLTTPLSDAALFGAPQTGVLLGLGVVGFVIFGTLYHIVPFIIWVDRYSDQLGYEPVPMIDDLYSDRLAAVDFGLLTTGTVAVVGGNWFGTESLLVTGGGLLMAGVVVFAANILLVLRVHSPDPLSVTLFGRRLRPTATRTRDGKPSGDEPLDE